MLGLTVLSIGAVSLWRRQRRRTRRLAASLEHLERLAAIGAIAASVAHEVKNPLMGIAGFSQLGQSSSDLAKMREYFAIIEQEALRANAVLEGMLDFARPDADPEIEPLCVATLIQTVSAMGEPQLKQNGVTLEVTVAQGLPRVMGDASQLRQVLMNLLLNAQHSVENAAVKTVTLSAVRDVKGIAISVTDTGPGFEGDAKRHAFAAFFTTKPRGQGTGLGLSISKGLVEAHHGELTIDDVAAGARVTMRLPALGQGV